MDLLRGAQPALQHPCRPSDPGLERFARHRLIQPTGPWGLCYKANPRAAIGSSAPDPTHRAHCGVT